MRTMLLRAVVPVALATTLLASFDAYRPSGSAAAIARSGTPPSDCGTCHAEIHDAWQKSRHAHAWTDPVYQAALRGLEHPERCHGCHAPEPVLARLGRPPRARAEDRHAGVTCVACHATRGRMAGPSGAATDAHESQEHPAFSEAGSVHLCGSCHDLAIGPVLPLARDFEAADLATRGKSCIGCHMPRGSHALRGPSDPEFCAQAFKIGVRRAGDRLELTIGNRAGHRVPGLTTRRFVFEVTQLEQRTQPSPDAATAPTQRVVLSAENPIYAAETRRFRFPIVPGAVAAEVAIFHEHDDRRVEVARDRHDL